MDESLVKTPSDLANISLALKREADSLLYDTGLAQTMSKYGEFFPTGSYALDLMTWRDLDLYLDIAQIDKNRTYDLVHEMALLLQPFWLEAKSMIENPEPDFPHGYFIGMETGLYASGVWNIDVLAMSHKDILEAQAIVDERKCAINTAMRETILKIKNHPKYRNVFSSIDVYNGVIYGSARSVEDLEHWLEGNSSGSGTTARSEAS